MGKEQGKRILFLECLLGNGFTDCLFLISTFVNTPEHFLMHLPCCRSLSRHCLNNSFRQEL